MIKKIISIFIVVVLTVPVRSYAEEAIMGAALAPSPAKPVDTGDQPADTTPPAQPAVIAPVPAVGAVAGAAAGTLVPAGALSAPTVSAAPSAASPAAPVVSDANAVTETAETANRLSVNRNADAEDEEETEEESPAMKQWREMAENLQKEIQKINQNYIDDLADIDKRLAEALKNATEDGEKWALTMASYQLKLAAYQKYMEELKIIQIRFGELADLARQIYDKAEKELKETLDRKLAAATTEEEREDAGNEWADGLALAVEEYQQRLDILRQSGWYGLGWLGNGSPYENQLELWEEWLEQGAPGSGWWWAAPFLGNNIPADEIVRLPNADTPASVMSTSYTVTQPALAEAEPVEAIAGTVQPGMTKPGTQNVTPDEDNEPGDFGVGSSFQGAVQVSAKMPENPDPDVLEQMQKMAHEALEEYLRKMQEIYKNLQITLDSAKTEEEREAARKAAEESLEKIKRIFDETIEKLIKSGWDSGEFILFALPKGPKIMTEIADAAAKELQAALEAISKEAEIRKQNATSEEEKWAIEKEAQEAADRALKIYEAKIELLKKDGWQGWPPKPAAPSVPLALESSPSEDVASLSYEVVSPSNDEVLARLNPFTPLIQTPGTQFLPAEPEQIPLVPTFPPVVNADITETSSFMDMTSLSYEVVSAALPQPISYALEDVAASQTLALAIDEAITPTREKFKEEYESYKELFKPRNFIDKEFLDKLKKFYNRMHELGEKESLTEEEKTLLKAMLELEKNGLGPGARPDNAINPKGPPPPNWKKWQQDLFENTFRPKGGIF